MSRRIAEEWRSSKDKQKYLQIEAVKTPENMTVAQKNVFLQAWKTICRIMINNDKFLVVKRRAVCYHKTSNILDNIYG
jgi:hypothetical protein